MVALKNTFSNVFFLFYDVVVFNLTLASYLKQLE